jgi:ATP-dependent RNA helicase DOB1
MQLEELKYRKRLLRRLGFIDELDTIQLKARVACEISSGDELLISELLFNRVFNELSPEQTAALLSCFVFEEKSNTEAKLKPELEKPYKELLSQAKLIAKISIESKLPVVEEEYCQKFKNQLMEVVYTWSQGASFATICKMTDVYEGSLIRMFRRLEELLRQMIMAAKAMGSPELEKKFEDAMGKVRRDIVNSGSLYL